jgi:hypothetical protein
MHTNAKLGRGLAPCLVVALLGACGGDEAPAGLDQRDGAALRELFPAQASRVLDGSGEAAGVFQARAQGFSRAPAGGLGVLLPREGAGALRFTAPGGFEVAVREIGAEGAGVPVEQAVRYRRAGGSAYWTAAEGGAEEWLLVEGSAVHRGQALAAWEVAGGALRQIGEVVEIDDAEGVPRVRVTAPAAYAAGGRAIDAKLALKGAQIELSVDAEGETVLVDPVWTSTALMSAGRTHYAAVLLDDGSVLAVGGRGTGNTFLAGAERYSPLTNTWSAAGAMSAGREWVRATMLGNGKVLATGGQNGLVSFANADLYDPATNSWAPTTPMPALRSTHTQTMLKDGRALVANGNTATAILYDPQTASWTPTGAMGGSRGHSAALRLANDTVLVAGGSSLSSAEIYDPASNDWKPTGAMGTARMFHRLTLLPDGRVLVTGGISSLGAAAKGTAEIYDPALALWSATPSMIAARQEHTATLLKNGTVLVAGGQNLASTEIYDPASNSWAAGASMSLARTSHSATLLDNGSVLVASGGAFSKTAEYYAQALGSPCVSNDQCPSGFCVDGVCCNAACNAGACDACSIAAGAPTDGTCAPVPNGTACNDGNACTQVDSCQAGVCTGASPVVCAAADPCHAAGVCNAATGGCDAPSQPDGTACNDGNACTQVDSCQAGVCTGGNAVVCAAVDACHAAGVCDAATGACSAPSQPDGTACNDGNACTQVDSCQAGVCTGASPVVCAAPDQCHAAGACDAASGACNYPNLADGTACNDHTLCVQGDACVAGVCVGASAAACTVCVTLRRDLGGTVADAAILQANSATNYGTWNTLLSGIQASKPVVSLLRFDLGAIPAGSTVISADLTLTALMISGSTTVRVHRVQGAWGEPTVKWNNFLVGFDGGVAASLPTALGPLTFNLTTLVQQWVSGTFANQGVALEQSTGYLYYASSERVGPAADLPTMKVCYQLP